MIKNHNSSKSISWQFANYVCSFGMNFVIQILLARLIEPNEFGSLAILNTIIAFADIFVQSGISTAIVQKKELNARDIFTAQLISGLTACFCCLIIVIGAPYISSIYKLPMLTIPLQVLSISLVFNSINSVFSSLLIRRMAYKKLFFRTVIVLPIAGIVGITLAYLQYGIWALVAYQMTMTVLNSIIYIVACEDNIECKFSKLGAKEMYSFGIKVLLTGLINNIYDTIRTLVIGGKYSKSDLAYYDRAQTYSKYTVQIAHSMISSVALPIFSQNQESIEQIKTDSKKIVGFSAFIMFPILFGVAGISRPLILVLLTEKWKATVPFLMIFCFMRLPGIITMIDKQMFYSIGRSDLILKYAVMSLVLNILSLTIVLPYGVMAIAVNTLIVEIIISIIIAVMSSRTMKYSIKEKMIDLWKPFLNSIIMFIVIRLLDIFLDLNLIILLAIEILVGMSCYFGLLILTRDKNLDRVKKMILTKVRK